MTIKQRLHIGNKFNGLCAYTGKPLGNDWQIDHMEPHFYATIYGRNPNRDENLVPAMGIVNHYKRCLDLEGFRKYMAAFHTRLGKLPKKTKVDKTLRRISYMNRVAEAFEITPTQPFSGMFYFETLTS